jgi:flagellar assembly protein FliH
MAVIRQSEALRLASEAISLDLGDLSRQADALIARARDQAAATLAQAKQERDKLFASVHEQAREQGHAKGLEQGRLAGLEVGRQEALAERREKLSQLDEKWTAAVTSFEASRAGMLLQAREDVLDLALLLAEKVTRRQCAVDRSVVVSQLEQVLAAIARPTALLVLVHPLDEPLVRAALPGVTSRFPAAQHVELRADATLAPGACLARTQGGGVIDASIETQLRRIAESLVPEREVAS